MKILFIHHRYHTNLFNWFRGFQQNGHEVRLLVYKPDEVNEPGLPKSTYLPPSQWSARKMEKNPRMRGDGVDSFSPYYYPSFRSVYNYFKREKPNLVVIRPVFSRFGYMVLIFTFLFRTKRVFYSQIRIHKPYPRYKKLIFHLAMWLLNANWVSPCLGDKERYPNAPTRMIYFPFAMPVTVTNQREYFREGDIHLLSVAKYFKSKNPLLVLEAFFKLCERHDNIRLTICGSGDEQGAYFVKMNDLKRKSAYGEKVDLLVNQPFSVVKELYLNHDIFVLPSTHDPASITNLEAMSHGLAVICSNLNGTAHYTIHGESGYVFNVNNKEGLFNYLCGLINDCQKIKVMGASALEHVKTNHYPKIITAEFLEKVK